mgnify:FL=1|jgi:histidinol-phosphate aminotransferase|tara:strand:+ start:10021 stop:11106 length:1086 start_codon:yes stop_codon:yes gene_type:complete
MTIPKFRKIGIESYRPGKSGIKNNKGFIKLSANESSLGVSSVVRKLLNNKTLITNRYPDSKSKLLRKAISKEFKCDFNKIICGAGSDEIIQMICQLYLNKNDEVILPEFSFLMYRIYSKIVGAKVKFSKENNFKISIENILKKVTRKTKIVFLANPNNPTGTYLNKFELITLRKKLNKKILLVIDDAYHEYNLNKNYVSGLDLFKRSKNVFILRTFSKIYGLASLRIGWGYGHKKIIDALYRIKPPFNVNLFAEKCATKAVSDKVFIKKSIRHNLFWGNKIKKIFENYKVSSNGIVSNFLLLNFKNCKISSKLFMSKLLNNGIIVRGMEEYKIKNSLRLSIGNSSENKYLVKVVKKIFKNV